MNTLIHAFARFRFLARVPSIQRQTDRSACMTDGSVRLLSTNLDLNIAVSLLTRERGENVSTTDF